ncbi:MAG: sulfotransferase [Alphaproteobacteria bacterium]
MTEQSRQPGAPIIICAPMARSGTTFCKFLLDSHPQVYRADLHEDYLLQNADSLRFYTETLFERWDGIRAKQSLGPEKSSPDALLSAIGSTLLQYIGQRNSPERLLLKTPRLCDLHVALRLFPGCQVLIMIRDPRSVVASYLRAQTDWGMAHSFESIAGRWAKSIRYLSELLAENQQAVRDNQYILVRYERLASDTENELRLLLEKLNLPMAPECMDLIENPIVRGSSFLPRGEDGRVDFRPQPMPENFNPLERWRDWTPERHAKFNRLCGSMMQKWGYTPVTGRGEG